MIRKIRYKDPNILAMQFTGSNYAELSAFISKHDHMKETFDEWQTGCGRKIVGGDWVVISGQCTQAPVSDEEFRQCFEFVPEIDIIEPVV